MDARGVTKADDDDGVRSRGEGLHRKRLAVTQIRHPRRCVADIQLAAVVGDRFPAFAGNDGGRFAGNDGAIVITRLVRVIPYDPQRPQRLVGLAIVSLEAGLEPFRQRIILRLERGTDRLDGAGIVAPGDIRMVQSPIRLTGPQRNVVERKDRRIDAAIDHGADAPVAYRERLLKKRRRMVILQHQRRRRFHYRRGMPAAERQQQRRQ